MNPESVATAKDRGKGWRCQPPPAPHLRQASSFALVATLLMIAVITGAAVAFFQSTRIERFVSRNYADLARAQLAAESGYALAAALIAGESANDHFIIVQNTNRQLFLGNASNQPYSNNAQVFAYVPLYSFTNPLTEYSSTNWILTNGMPSNSSSAGTVIFTNTLPGGLTVTSPPLQWVFLTNASGRTNARFAFWVEDLSGRLDLSVAGSTGTNAGRPTGTNPAELALWRLFNTNVDSDTTNAVVVGLTNARGALLTPATARLVNSNAVTTNLLADLSANLIYDTSEPDLVPYGFNYTNQGQPKLNLNWAATLPQTNTNPVNLIAAQITNNLPNFATRAGGLTNAILYPSGDFDYAKCLAANILDYIDTNSIPTVLDAAQGYCGIEALPYLTEVGMRIRLEQDSGGTYNDNNDITNCVPPTSTTIPPVVGPVRIQTSFNVYCEFWNPFSIPVVFSNFSSSQALNLSLKTYGTNSTNSTEAFAIGFNGLIRTLDSMANQYEKGASGPLSNLVFSFSTADATNLTGISSNNPTLQPNQYCSIRCKYNTGTGNWVTNTNSLNSAEWGITNKTGTNQYRFKYQANALNRKIWLSQNTTNFTSACLAGGGGVNIPSAASNNPSTAGLFELSLIGANGSNQPPYFRMRNMRFTENSIDATTASPSASAVWLLWRPASRIFNGSVATNIAGDPRIAYFLRSPSGGELHPNVSWTNTNTGGNSFGGPNQGFDITKWPDGGQAPLQLGQYSSSEPTGGNITVADTGTNRAPGFIRNAPMTNISELGNIYDPILWSSTKANGLIDSGSTPDPRIGGGNTLRVGRGEHTRFTNDGLRASQLLDLFGVDATNSQYVTNRVIGRINLNTATTNTLRALVAGVLLTNDPVLASTNFPMPNSAVLAFSRAVANFRTNRPFASPSQLTLLTNTVAGSTWPSNSVFGNGSPAGEGGVMGASGVTWSDAAAEEWFAKIYPLCTVRSRNFLIHVIGQAMSTNTNAASRPLATARQMYQIYAFPTRSSNVVTNVTIQKLGMWSL